MTRDAAAELAANIGFRVDNGRVEYNGVPRPATPEESLLWGQAVVHKQALNRMTDIVAQTDVDRRSLEASCKAYKEELEKLRVYAQANSYEPQTPSEQTTTLELFAAIVQTHDEQKKRLLQKAREIWDIPPGTDIIDFMFRQLQHINGELMHETEQRRIEHVRARSVSQFANEMQAKPSMDEYLNELHGRAAGTRVVRDNPQA